MSFRAGLFPFVIPMAISIAACSGTGSGKGTNPATGTGGTTAVVPSTGGASGTVGTGGDTGAGGTARGDGGSGSGGLPGTGGASPGTGGAARGGSSGGAGSGTGGVTTTGGSASGGVVGRGGAGPGSGGGAGATIGGATGRGGSAGAPAIDGGGTGGAPGRGGSGASTGGTASTGGAAAGGATGTGGTLDCGPDGYAVEFHGPPANRVNYVILGDGYTTADLVAGGTFETHIKNAMTERFGPLAEPYTRYRNFVNICAIKIVSTGAICGSSALGCCGDDQSRLANCTTSAVNAAFNALPASLSIDWRAVVLNGSSWWNTGAATMLWSGANSNGPKAALHEGGHGFHQLADEYCAAGSGTTCGPDTAGTGTVGTEHPEVNSTGNPATTGGKWDQWLGYTQANATGLQSTFQGSYYVDSGQYRPSGNSKMNSLFGNNVNTCFNPVSQEQMVMSIWRIVKPIDSVAPPAGAVTSPGVLTVNVIDPAVISVDWTVDGVTTVAGGPTFDTASLAAGSHTISATAYDNAGNDLVRYRGSTCPSSVTGGYCTRTAWKNSTQTVSWTVSK